MSHRCPTGGVVAICRTVRSISSGWTSCPSSAHGQPARQSASQPTYTCSLHILNILLHYSCQSLVVIDVEGVIQTACGMFIYFSAVADIWGLNCSDCIFCCLQT